MKNSTNAIVNAALAVAVAILFYLQLSGPKEEKPTTVEVEEINEEMPQDEESIVAYVDADSVMKHYKLAEDYRIAIKNEQAKYQKDLENKGRSFQSEYQSLQAKAGTMSQSELSLRQKSLQSRQEKLMQTEQMYMEKMQIFQLEKEAELNRKVAEYLEVYCADKSYRMVLSQGAISTILYGDASLNITDAVLKGLNEQYDETHNITE